MILNFIFIFKKMISGPWHLDVKNDLVYELKEFISNPQKYNFPSLESIGIPDLDPEGELSYLNLNNLQWLERSYAHNVNLNNDIFNINQYNTIIVIDQTTLKYFDDKESASNFLNKCSEVRSKIVNP